MEAKGRQFITQLYKFVFGIVGRRQPPIECQYYSSAGTSPFSGKLINAIIIIITDNINNIDKLPTITSKKFRDELNSIAFDEEFLKFIGRYSAKVLSEFCNGEELAPSSFMRHVTEFLRRQSIAEVNIDHFVSNWHLASEKIVKASEDWLRSIKFDLHFFVDLDEEKDYAIAIINLAYDILNAKEEIKLEVESSMYIETDSIKSALELAMHHHKQYLQVCDYEQLREYFHRKCYKRFDFKTFLELCACCTTIAAAENPSLQTSQDTCDLLLRVLENAKRNEDFTSISEMITDAKELVKTFEELYPQPREQGGVLPVFEL